MRDFQLGRYVIPEPSRRASADNEGSLSEDANDGPLGNEILRRFRIVLDYSRRRMMLEPNAHLADPIEAGHEWNRFRYGRLPAVQGKESAGELSGG